MVMLACIGPEHMIWTWTWAYNMGWIGWGAFLCGPFCHLWPKVSCRGEIFPDILSPPLCSSMLVADPPSIHWDSHPIWPTRITQRAGGPLGPMNIFLSVFKLQPYGTKCHLILTSYISNQIQWQGRKEVIGYTSWYLKFSHAAKKSFFVSN